MRGSPKVRKSESPEDVQIEDPRRSDDLKVVFSGQI